ncbi:protein YgfX [Pseudomonas tohonis]|uniref:Toxin CptA n=1 Tax=Pseudomonas tohonis TaxID=2725477 RepID=A0A6J4EAB9_9PSED|nr:protein YgfX [Pseudomonas tohonis]BCG26206.1 hypothetical protein TUM18999_43970 [Pseudomonas tohonis]GJN51061.1 hypothetical protein TUM20286_08130 [Pseudomonas tohonis]
MSSPSSAFECHWRPSRRLLVLYLSLFSLALVAVACAELPRWAQLACLFACLAHAAWTLPRQVLLASASSIRGLRLDADGWRLRRHDGQWCAVRLSPDSLALPMVVLLVYRPEGAIMTRGLCIPADSLDERSHRRLRVHLRFNRHRWVAPG